MAGTCWSFAGSLKKGLPPRIKKVHKPFACQLLNDFKPEKPNLARVKKQLPNYCYT
jgi:hypothetical protein